MNSEAKKFHSILDNEWKSNVEKYPEWATRLGDNRFNDKLNNASYETIINRQEEAVKLLDKIKEISYKLNPFLRISAVELAKSTAAC